MIQWYGMKGIRGNMEFYYVWLNVVIVYHLPSHEQLGVFDYDGENSSYVVVRHSRHKTFLGGAESSSVRP